MVWDILASGSGKCRSASGDRGVGPVRIALLALVVALLPLRETAFPLGGDQTVLPAGTEFAEDALARPRELFHSEAIGGRKEPKFSNDAAAMIVLSDAIHVMLLTHSFYSSFTGKPIFSIAA